MNTIYIGCHLSVTKGYEAMGKTMLDFGGNTFAFFTRNPRGGKSKELLPEDAAALRALVDREHFAPLVAHGSYTMNLCAAKSETRENGLDMLEKDLVRMEQLPGNFYNFHPGAHTGQGMEQGIALIAEALNRFLWPEMQTTVLLETMAGKGSKPVLTLRIKTFEVCLRLLQGGAPRQNGSPQKKNRTTRFTDNSVLFCTKELSTLRIYQGFSFPDKRKVK